MEMLKSNELLDGNKHKDKKVELVLDLYDVVFLKNYGWKKFEQHYFKD